MSDQLAGKVGFNQNGQAGQPVVPENASQTQEQPNTDQTPKFVTEDKFLATLEEYKRQTQGLIDKNVSRLDKRVSEATEQVNQMINLGREAGMQFTPEQEAAMRDKAINKALSAEAASSQPASQRNASPAQVVNNEGDHVDPDTAWMEAVMSGAEVPEDAPELKMIDTVTTDRKAYRKSVLAAVSAYHDRISKPVGSPANVPTAAARGTGAGQDLTQQFEKEMLAARGQGAIKGREIRERYRKLGVDVDSIGYKIQA